jgi:uncharacterized membrane protein YbhN (UPF0104 family)
LKFKSTYSITILKLGFICLCLFWIYRQINIEKFYHVLSGVSLSWLFIAILLQHSTQMISAKRSQFYIENYGLKLRLPFVMALYYVGSFFNIILPGGIGGDGYKILKLKNKFSLSKTTGFRIALYERVNGFYALVIYLFIIALCSSFAKIPMAQPLLFTLLLLTTPLYIFGIKYVLKDKLQVAFKAAIKYSFPAQALQLLVGYALIQTLNSHLTLEDSLNFYTLYILSTIMALIPISIGGVGLRELTFFYGISFLENPQLQIIGLAFATLVFVSYVLMAIIGLPLFFILDKIKAS